MLTEKQKKILDIVRENPGIKLKDLASKLNLKAVSTVHAHLKALIKENYLIKENGILKETGRDENEFTPIPFYGYAQCGDTDIFAEENIVDYVNMPTRFLPHPINDLFFIKAKGDSMEPTIQDGDLLMFRKLNGQQPPLNSVVLCRRDNGIKIKRFCKFNGNNTFEYRLVSDNKAKYEPFPLDESVTILGKWVKMN